MATAFDRGWGDASQSNYRQNNIVAIKNGGITLYVHKTVAPLFAAFIDRVVKKGYIFTKNADDWGYNYRPIRGYEDEWKATHNLKYLSNHSWGLAVDFNSMTNPMTSDGVVHTDMPTWVINEATEIGLYWGGFYASKRKDPMHFEFLGTPENAKRKVAELNSSTGGDELLADEREAVMTANHFVKVIWPAYASKIDEIFDMLKVVKDGAPGYGVLSTPVAVTELHRKVVQGK